MLSNRASARSRWFRGHNEATAKCGERGFELLDADGVVAVQDMSDLLRGPAQPLGQLCLVEPGLAHRAVNFELCGCQSGEPRHGTPLRRRRSWDILMVGDHAEDRFLEHVLGL